MFIFFLVYILNYSMFVFVIGFYVKAIQQPYQFLKKHCFLSFKEFYNKTYKVRQFHKNNNETIIMFMFTLEFIPYVFQLLSLMMEMHPPGSVPDPYMQLFPCLVVPALWERPANCSPLVRLLCAFVTQAPNQIISLDKIVSFLLFQMNKKITIKFLSEWFARYFPKTYRFENIRP